MKSFFLIFLLSIAQRAFGILLKPFVHTFDMELMEAFKNPQLLVAKVKVIKAYRAGSLLINPSLPILFNLRGFLLSFFVRENWHLLYFIISQSFNLFIRLRPVVLHYLSFLCRYQSLHSL